MRSRAARSVPPGTVQAHGIRQWWLNRSLRAKGLIVVAVPLIALMGLTSAILLLQHNESSERTISLNARNLDDAAYRVLADTVNGETGVRGNAATRDPAVLEGDGGQQRVVDATTGRDLSELAQLGTAISRGASAGNAVQHDKITALQARTELLDIAGIESGDLSLSLEPTP